MSTEIKTIKGSYDYKISNTYKVTRKEAEISLTRFFAGIKKGSNIQLTISQERAYTSYINLTENQCKRLAKTLLECFDTNKYPSE